ncbi:MAG: GntR family transcriptional regulator [Gammaproteobacteria bacterium]|nr:GntR family transcriptional regulator [Gammaproteobacteria bacterium]MDD9870135.1 GntR family transcriptional regulator [Gammaproteobacteria bacterium]
MAGAAASAGLESARPFERIVQTIRTRILYGDYEPGRHVSEQQIATEFGVSRTSVRGAMHFLCAEGVLSLVPNRGAVVPKYDRRLIENTIEIVEHMEAAAGELACRRIGEEKVDWIDFLTGQMHAAFKREQRLRYYQLNKQIHEEIVQASGNSVLIGDYVKYNNRLYRTRFLPGDNQVILASAMEEHLRMVDLLRKRDGKALGALLSRHLSHAWRRAGVNPVHADAANNPREKTG